MARNVLLIGRPASGKTCMAKIMSGLEPPKEHYSTVKPTKYEANNGFIFFNFGNTKICEIGGNDQNQITWLDNKENFLNDIIFYVFDGNEFLKELDNHWKGGPIGAEIRNDFKGAYSAFIKLGKDFCKEELDNINRLLINGLPDNIYFIATHEDECENMKEKIISKMQTIQNEYPGRYFFHQKMMATLQCINATNTDEVKKMFKEIVE